MNYRVMLLMSVLLSGSALGASESNNVGMGIRAITRPSADRILSFVQPGRILEVLFKDGDQVKTGEVLVRLDDRAEQVQLAQLQAQSLDRTQIMASEVSLAQKRVDLQKLEKAASFRAATELEVEHARLAVTVAELSKVLAEFEHEQNGLKYEEAVIRVENMRLKTPISGTVEQISMEAGESVSSNLEEVVRVVQTDPLWIDANLSIIRAAALKLGAKVRVAFPAPDAGMREGTVIYIATVADAGSSTLKLRVEVPNKTRRPAGEHVQVFCPTSP
jgi:RND family efflux transporter MFP subunit